MDRDTVRKTDDVFETAEKKFKIHSSICYLISDLDVGLSSVCPFIRYGNSIVYSKLKNCEIAILCQHEEEIERSSL